MKHKKLISWLLTLVLMLSAFSAGASAVFGTESGEAEQSAGFLSSVSFAAGSSSTAEKFLMTPEFDSEIKAYQVATADDVTSMYVWAQLSDAGQGATIKAKWTKSTGGESTMAITSGSSSGRYLASVQEAGGNGGSEIILEVAKGEIVQEYTFTTQVTDRFLSGLTVKADGKKLKLTPSFSKTKKEYTAGTTTDVTSVTVIPSAAYESYDIKVDGRDVENGQAAVELGEDLSKTIPILVSKEESSVEGHYSITINRIDAVKVAFNISPENAILVIKDDQGQTIKPDKNGKYSFIPDETYTYTFTKYGYVGKKGELSFSADTAEITKKLSLVKAEENNSINKSIPSYWSSFRGNDSNMAITSAQTPTSANNTLLKWAKKYGTGWSASPCVQIIVDNKIVTIVSNKIYMLNPETGEVVKEGELVGSTNWGYTPPTYADGMIFCPLSNGRVQAVNADTLESLWVYQDELQGQSLSPITYKDGYIYTGFWNAETKDANYVCLSITDENPSETNEAKIPTWTYRHEGGFYWAGSVAVGDAIIFGTDDGTSGYTGESDLLSVDRSTGEIISSLKLTGDQRSTIAYNEADGRVYGTTKAGYLFSAAVDKSSGELSDLMMKNYGKEGDSPSALMSTSTPIIYKGTAYIGCTSSGNFGGQGYCMIAADTEDLSEKYRIPLKGYPQGSGLLSNAYEKDTGKIYLYWTYNNMPGGITMIEASADAVNADDVKAEEIYDAKGYEQYCITSLICGEDGTIYYKNDTGNIFGVSKNDAFLKNIQLTGGNAALTDDFNAGNLEYEAVVDPGTSAVDLKLAADEDVNIVIDGTRYTAEKAVALKNGKAEVVIETSKGAYSRTYKLNIRERSQQAQLSKLMVNESNSYTGAAKALTPEFNADIKDYTVYSAGASRTFENLWPDAEDTNAEVKVYAVSGVNPAYIDDEKTGEITVTAENQGHSRYAVYFASGCRTSIVRVVVTSEAGTNAEDYYVVITKNAGSDSLAEEMMESDEYDGEYVIGLLKEAAKETISTYNEDAVYTGSDKDEYDYIIASAVKALKKAQTKEDISDIIADVEARIGMLETDDVKLSNKKQEAVELIDDYISTEISLDDYRQEQQLQITQAADAAKEAVEAADTAEAVKDAVAQFKTVVRDIDTDAELTALEEKAEADRQSEAAAEISAAKAQAKARLGNYTDTAQYRTAEIIQLLGAVIRYDVAIDAAESVESVNVILADAEAELAKIKTDADYKTEAMNSAEITALTKAASYNKITVSWNKVPEAEKYQIYRSSSQNGNYSMIAETGNTSATDNKSIKTGVTYYYKVRACVTIDGKLIFSDYSAVKTAKTVPAMPAKVKVKAGKKKASVSWNKAAGATGYKIYRATSKNGKYKLVKTISKSSTLKYTNKNLKTGKVYYYKVKAFTKTSAGVVYGKASGAVKVKAK